MIDPRPTSIIILAQVPRVCPEMRMSRIRIVPTIVPKFPAIDGAVAAALVAQVLQQSGSPVVGPVAPCIDVDLGIPVLVTSAAVYERAAGGVVALFERVGGVGDGGGCAGGEAGQGCGGEQVV